MHISCYVTLETAAVAPLELEHSKSEFQHMFPIVSDTGWYLKSFSGWRLCICCVALIMAAVAPPDYCYYCYSAAIHNIAMIMITTITMITTIIIITVTFTITINIMLRPIPPLTLSLLTLLDSNFQVGSLWAWAFHPFELRVCLSQTLWNPNS